MNVDVQEMFLILRAVIAAMRSQNPITPILRRPPEKPAVDPILTRCNLRLLILPFSTAHWTGGIDRTDLFTIGSLPAVASITHHIKVNYVCPSWVVTPLTQGFIVQFLIIQQETSSQLPIGWTALLEGVADAAAFH
ncbi:hypothetical protein GGR58DRAFT_487529 [Xylaria digitata]|nr:hypothetical protein GGR58DRAFT_487529 [Xylaria digitata]